MMILFAIGPCRNLVVWIGMQWRKRNRYLMSLAAGMNHGMNVLISVLEGVRSRSILGPVS